MRTADLEPAGRIDIIHNVVIQQLGRNNLFHNFLDESFQPLDVHVRRVLVRNHDRGQRNRLAFGVADRNLALRVGPQVTVVLRIGVAQPREFLDDLVRIIDRRRHVGGRLVRRVTEHHSLVAGALLGEEALTFGHALRDVRRLLVDADHHLRIIGAETDAMFIVTDLADRVESDLLPDRLQ